MDEGLEYAGVLFGMKVIQDINMTDEAPMVYRLRPWKERLFTRPWRPLQEGVWMPQRRPSRRILQLGFNTLVMHPAMWQKLQAERQTRERD
jgi:hypothetical protein